MRPVIENKIEIRKTACGLDVNSDFSIDFVQNIADKIETVAEKKVKAKRNGESF